MRAASRLLTGAAAAALAIGIMAGPAAAEDLTVTGTYTGTGTLVSTSCTTAFGVDAEGSGDWTALGATSFTLHFCNRAAPDITIDDGRFTITTAEGTITGDMSGTVDAYRPFPSTQFPFHLTLDIGSGTGTGRFADATGELVLDGAFGLGAGTFSGTVAGTIHLPDPTPTSRDDCRHGGWQDLADDAGTPFANQGQCLAWVNRHT
jgi:hypothetical protein